MSLQSGSTAIELSVAPEAVWALLTGPGLRDWYYRLAAHGTFAPGERIAWKDANGEKLEDSEVVEVEPPSRLVFRTRFLFSPGLATLQPHLITWEVAPKGDGSTVRMSWEAESDVARLLDSDAGGQLKGLRLAADPAARAELERLPEIGRVEVRDVTPERVPDWLEFFDHRAFADFPVWQFCYCMETHRTQSEEEWMRRTRDDNRRDMSEMIRSGDVTGLLAYVDGKAVGWCNYGPTTRLGGVMMKLGLEAPEHEGVGSVACFVIAAPYRGHGVATKLLDAAIARLRDRGLRAVEAYPSRSANPSAQSHYRGAMAMFLHAGFEPYRERERYLILRKTLA